MIICIKCKAEKLKCIHKSITDPRYDLFECPACEQKQYRYEGTELQRPGDPVYKNRA
jgi:hypothetical protein